MCRYGFNGNFDLQSLGQSPVGPMHTDAYNFEWTEEVLENSACLGLYCKVSIQTASCCYKYIKASTFSLCLCVFVFFMLFFQFCWILMETKRERDRERERACVKVLTAIKAIQRCWHKYLTLRGNLQHVMSRPWLGWTVTPSHITWFHVWEWRGGVCACVSAS